MQKTFTCKHCKKEKRANFRLKGKQEYCGDYACRKVYKAAWQKNKKAIDVEYVKKQEQCNDRWKISKPANKYQDQYRKRNPAYVKKNRIQQRQRNQKRKKQHNKPTCPVIVKMDSLTDLKSRYYTMNSYKINESKKIVKMDSLIIQIALLEDNKLDEFEIFT